MTPACCRRSPTGLVIRIATSAATLRSSSPASAIRAGYRRSPTSSPTEASDPRVKESRACRRRTISLRAASCVRPLLRGASAGRFAGFARNCAARAAPRRSGDAINRAVVARTNRRQARNPAADCRARQRRSVKRVLVIYALEALHAKEAVPRLLTLVNDDRKSRFGALVTVSEAAKAAIARLQ